MTEIRPYLQKQGWHRRAPRMVAASSSSIDRFATTEMTFDTGFVHNMTQSDFMDELVPSAHKINHCEYRANRPKYRYDAAKKENVPDGLEEVERVEVGFQEGALRHKVTTTFGNPMWFGSNGKDAKTDEIIANIRSHWELSGMTDALSTWGRSLFGTGDAAIYLYKDGDAVNYEVFSFEKGDVFNFTKDENNKDIFVRMLKVNGFTTVEIYDDTNISVWIKKDESVKLAELYKKAVNKLKGSPKEISTDGFELVSRTAHGCSRCPVTYWRLNDVVWGVGQSGIERLERILSDLGENNRYYAYQILFIAGGVMNLPPAGRQGKTIASKSTDGKAEILQPADASNTFTIDLEKNIELLCETLALIILNPADLNGGDYSGAFIKNLYWREVQWSTNMIAELRPALARLVSIFQELVGQVEGNAAAYKKVRFPFLLEPYVPKNVTEEITNACMAKNAGVSSVQTVAMEIPFNNPREVELLKREKMEKEAREDALALLKRKTVETKSKDDTTPTAEVVEKGEGANNQAK